LRGSQQERWQHRRIEKPNYPPLGNEGRFIKKDLTIRPQPNSLATGFFAGKRNPNQKKKKKASEGKVGAGGEKKKKEFAKWEKPRR